MLGFMHLSLENIFVSVALAVASSGTTATELTGGRTAHSRFKINCIDGNFRIDSHFLLCSTDPSNREVKKFARGCFILRLFKAALQVFHSGREYEAHERKRCNGCCLR